MEQEKSYQEIRKETIENYNTFVIPKLAKVEEQRKETFKKYKHTGKLFFLAKNTGFILLFCALSFFPILFLVIMTLYYLADDIFVISPYTANNIRNVFLIVFTLIYGGIPCISLLGWIEFHNYFYVELKDFKKKFKSKTVRTICMCFPNLKWSLSPFEMMSTRMLFDSKITTVQWYCICRLIDAKIIPNFCKDSYYTVHDDSFNGAYNGVSFSIDEYKVRDDIKSFFKGMVIQFNMNKFFRSHTIIRPNTLLHISPSKNLHHTVLEDVEFESKYDVFTNDDVEARYLITTAFMKRLNDIKMSFDSDKIYAAFKDGMFFLGLNTKLDLFDFDETDYTKNKPLPYDKHFNKTLEGLISIYKLIDYFKLNQNIGM